MYYYTECLIVQVICQNITVPNITTETYTKYNNYIILIVRNKQISEGVSLISTLVEVYSIQHYVIKFDNDLWQDFFIYFYLL